MKPEKRPNDSSPTLDIVPADEDGRQPCRPSCDDLPTCDSELNRPRRIRSEQSRRELYQNHFPPE